VGPHQARVRDTHEVSGWHIEFTSSARRRLERIHPEPRGRIETAIAALVDDPRPASAKRLVGRTEYWRIRVGSYRVVYTIEDDRLVILVLTLGHRRDVYRGL